MTEPCVVSQLTPARTVAVIFECVMSLALFPCKWSKPLIGNPGEAFASEGPITDHACAAVRSFPGIRLDIRRSWHLYGVVNPEGCPGFKGPVPQPVSMSIDLQSSEDRTDVKSKKRVRLNFFQKIQPDPWPRGWSRGEITLLVFVVVDFLKLRVDHIIGCGLGR